MRPEIAERVGRFPDEPGVYIFTDAKGKALYVGKAARLRSRVRSYLKPGGDGRIQLTFLEREAKDVEFLVTQTEQEALLLENTIIKKRRPVYNVKLRDDKSFLMLRLDRNEEWPWFRLVRRRKDDGAEYFGPYASAKSVRRTLRLLHKVVPLRDCSKSIFDNRSRPCLKHQIGRCPAPCVGLIANLEYQELVGEAVSVLRGGAGKVLRRLEDEMRAASEGLEFEKAQAKKLQIGALQAVAERQSVVESSEGDRDVVGMHAAEGEAVAVILHFRSGRLESSSRFKVPSALPTGLLLEDLLDRYYQGDRFIPAEILVPEEVPEAETLLQWLESKRGRSLKISVPKRGSRRRYLEMAQENARLQELLEADEGQRRRQALLNLAEICGLEGVPSRIHCMDISTIQGRDTVASRVCFVDGVPDKSCYRRFKISQAAAGDDFSAMSEAVRRSLTQCASKEDDDLPDLLVVDGGKGQLSSALDSTRELGLV
ncbi:MAG: excinuclease ABC subunit UvrC, partial [Planctomycetota bacterium]